MSNEVAPSQRKNDSAAMVTPTTSPKNSSAALGPMEYSQHASRLLKEERYTDSLRCYGQALELYQQTAKEQEKDASLISMCNAAGCLRNMGAIHRKTKRYELASHCWQRAEQLYRDCRKRARELIDSKENQHQRIQQATEHLCLDALIIETLTSRASLHVKQKRVKGAMECHEAVLCVLNSLEESQEWNDQERYTAIVEGVSLQPLLKQKHFDHLILSLESLLDLYISTKDTSVDFATVEHACSILQSRYEEEDEENRLENLKIERLMHILRNLSSIFFRKGDIDRACELWLRAIDLEVAHGQEPTAAALDTMDRMAKAKEDVQDYDKALALYEKALMVRSQFLGNEHIEVAKSLVNVGRVMESQGNTEGSLDLYHAAQSIYKNLVTSKDFTVQAEDSGIILQLIPNLMDQGRYEEAVSYLNKCLEADEEQEQEEKSSVLDRAQIYFDLGQAYMALRDYISATVCLIEAAKQDDDVVGQEKIYSLLMRVEFLRRKAKKNDMPEPDYIGRRDQDGRRPDDSEHMESSTSTGESDDATELVGTEITVQEFEGNRIVYSLSNQQSPPPSPLAKRSNLAQKDHMHGKSNRPRRNSTPVTAEMFTASGSKSDRDESYRADSEREDSHNEGLGDVVESSSEASASHHREASSSFLSSDLHSEAEKKPPPSPLHIDPAAAESALPSPFNTTTMSPAGVSYDLGSVSEKVSYADSSPRDSESRLTGSTSWASPPSEDGNEDHMRSDEALLSSSQDVRSPKSLKKKKSKPSLGLRIPLGSPRRSSSGSDSRQTPRSARAGNLTSKFRRKRRDGFESLPEEKESDMPHPDEFEEQYHTSFDGAFDGPIPFVSVSGRTKSWDDNVSQITLRLDDPNNSRGRGNEWWWGVTPEGFGRWFPTSYVSKAVEAAEGFLSAKAIHAKVRSAPLHFTSDDESSDEQESKFHSSQLGIADSKTMGGKHGESAKRSQVQQNEDLAPSQMLRRQSILSATSPRHQQKEKEMQAELMEQVELVRLQKEELGTSHPEIATSLYYLAVLYRRSREIESAIESGKEAVAIQKANGNLQDAAQSLHLLAELYMQQEDFKPSLKYFHEALRIEAKEYGYSSEETAKTLNCIGTVHSLKNEFGLAMNSHQEALRILKVCYGEGLKEPLVSQTLCQIGSVYYRERNSPSANKARAEDYTTFIEAGMLEIIGRAHEDRGSYKMAIAFFEEKLQFLQNSSDEEEVATTLNSLGMLSARAGLFYEAIDYYEKALNIQVQLQCDQINLATARVLTGTVQFQLGNWQNALKLLQEALTVLRQELGDKHETVAATLYHTGVVQAAFCEYDEATLALEEACDIQTNLLGSDHPATLRTRREIANICAVYESELESVFHELKEVLAAQRRVHGEKHPNIAETLHSIGCAYERQGDYTNALRWLEECYYMRLEFLGVDHPLQATTLHEIAKIHLARGRDKKALEICNVVLGIRTESLSERHIDVARALATKASSLTSLGDYNRAEKYFDQALPMAEGTVGASHPCVADIYVQVATMHLRMCNFEKARVVTTKALDMYRQGNLDEDYPGIRDASGLLETVERDEKLCV